jgi:hypothetical protein
VGSLVSFSHSLQLIPGTPAPDIKTILISIQEEEEEDKFDFDEDEEEEESDFDEDVPMKRPAAAQKRPAAAEKNTGNAFAKSRVKFVQDFSIPEGFCQG